MKYYGVLDKGPHYMEIVDELPDWSENDKGRILYYNNDIYYGSDTKWIKQEGSSGHSGYDGIDGTFALSGYSGYSGYFGSSGMSGYSGISQENDITINPTSRKSHIEFKNGLIINYGYKYDDRIKVGVHTVNYSKPFTTKCIYANAIPVMHSSSSFYNLIYLESWIHVINITLLTEAKFALYSRLTRDDFAGVISDSALGFYWISIGY